MSIYAPVYRPAEGQHTHLARVQQFERKRKWNEEGSDASDADEDVGRKALPTHETTPRTASTSFHHPVNRTDQYYVAGHPRGAPVPTFPFPHASVKSPKPQKAVEEELAGLNPPLYVPKRQPDDGAASSLKRRHVENLTALMHTCMLKGDWQRASRAWALLIRTEIGGRGIDVRQHGRWAMGAELLMRTTQKVSQSYAQEPLASMNGRELLGNDADEARVPAHSNEGFQLARQYYERLILQYPHTPRTQHMVNALAFYPALFNIWVYEVQDRSKRARRQAPTEQPTSPTASEHSADFSTSSSIRTAARLIRKSELDEALPIAKRMDELLLSPPYDTSLPLLQLRGMVGLWLSDLYAGLASPSPSDNEGSEHSFSDPGSTQQYRQREGTEKKRALKLLGKVKAMGGELSSSISSMLIGDDDTPV